jgi:hypothetical protein
MEYEYVPFTITIGDPSKSKNLQYRVKYGKPVLGKLQWGDLTKITVERLDQLVREHEEQSKGEILSLLGLHLYNILFGDKDVAEAFKATYDEFRSECLRRERNGDRCLRLRVQFVFSQEAEELARFPWEFTFVPIPDMKNGFFLSGSKTELILTRYVPELDFAKGLEPENDPVKIMIVFCQPDGMEAELDEDEVRILNEILDPLVKEGHVKVIPASPCLRDPTFQQLINAINQETPHILHFIGHGETGKLALIKDKSAPDYDIDKGGKQVSFITPTQIRGLFNNHKPRLIFLNSCKGAAASLESFNSTALDLVYHEVPAVVAMQYDIANEDAKFFATKFYEQISQGKEIDEAVKAGRIALGERCGWDDRRFGTPVVYLQSETALFKKRPPKMQVATEQIKCPDPRCGALSPPDSKFCCRCGKPLPVEAERLVAGSSKKLKDERAKPVPMVQVSSSFSNE